METEKNIKRNQHFWNFIFTIDFIIILGLAAYFLYINNKIKAIPLFDFILIILAIFRLVHLLIHDHITNYIRDYFQKFEKGPGKTMFVLLSCPWCAGIWIALAVSFFYFLTPFNWYLILIFALAGAGTLLEIIAHRIMR